MLAHIALFIFTKVSDVLLSKWYPKNRKKFWNCSYIEYFKGLWYVRVFYAIISVVSYLLKHFFQSERNSEKFSAMTPKGTSFHHTFKARKASPKCFLIPQLFAYILRQ